MEVEANLENLLRALILGAARATDDVLVAYQKAKPESHAAFWTLLNQAGARPYVEVIVGESRLEFGFIHDGKREAIFRWSVELDRSALN